MLYSSGSIKFDGFVNSPISALRFSALSLRRTGSTPHSTRFARLELGLFTKPSIRMPFYGFIKFNVLLGMPTVSAAGLIVSELGMHIQGHLGSKL
jgi:hypothetical protein